MRHLLYGSLPALDRTIKILPALGYADPNGWSEPLPSAPGRWGSPLRQPHRGDATERSRGGSTERSRGGSTERSQGGSTERSRGGSTERSRGVDSDLHQNPANGVV